MIKLLDFLKTKNPSKQEDATKLFLEWQESSVLDISIDLEGIEIVATAFFNKVFFLFREINWTTDMVLNKIRIENAREIHMFAFQSAVDVSFNKESNG